MADAVAFKDDAFIVVGSNAEAQAVTGEEAIEDATGVELDFEGDEGYRGSFQ